MEFRAWEPTYRRLLADFGFSREADQASARELKELLRGRPGWRSGPRGARAISEILEGADVLVVGGGPGPIPLPLPPLLLRRKGPRGWRVVAADGATTRCLSVAHVPDLIVTDLDGDMPDEVEANRRGALALLHAHGDNREGLRRWVSRFPGAVVGTCASRPTGGLLNPGGFTDGDRSVVLAEAFGARQVVLAGFDLRRPWREPEQTRGVKARKLRLASEIIGEVSERGNLPVLRWTRGGRLSRWVVPSGALRRTRARRRPTGSGHRS